MTEQSEYRRIAAPAAVGQGQQALTEIADGGHVEGFPQYGGTASRVHGGYDMDGIVGVLGQFPAGFHQGGAAAEKEDSGPELGTVAEKFETPRFAKIDFAHQG